MSFCLVLFMLLYADVSLQSTTTTTSPALVRLSGNNRPPNAGRLEVYYNDTWGTVCKYHFDQTDAQVACRMLGFGRAGQQMGSYYGSGSGSIWLDHLQCTGSEMSLAECEHRGWGVHYCHHNNDVSIICDNNCSATHPECAAAWNIDVKSLYYRVVAGTATEEELLSSCSAWSNCSMLVQSEGCISHYLSTQTAELLDETSGRDDIQQRYRQVNDSMRHLCTGVAPDYDIYQACYSRNLFGDLRHQCDYSKATITYSCDRLQARIYCFVRVIHEACSALEAADINVLKTTVYYLLVSERSCTLDVDQLIDNAAFLHEILDSMPRLAVRLAGDNRPPNAGRLEVFYNATWGTVCRGPFFDDSDARVACYMLGFGRAGLYLGNYFGDSSGPAWLNYVDCGGNELSLAECGHNFWDAHYIRCGSGTEVSIICAKNNSDCSATYPACEMLWNWNTNVSNLTSGLDNSLFSAVLAIFPVTLFRLP